MNSEKSGFVTVVLVQELIQDLVNAGMSYARISTRLGLSPSTIQKIISKNRIPRLKTLVCICNYYLKIFEFPQNYGSAVFSYHSKNEHRIKDTICKAKFLLVGLSS